MDKRTLSDRDICTKFITPALHRAGWDEMLTTADPSQCLSIRPIARRMSAANHRAPCSSKLVAGRRRDQPVHEKWSEADADLLED
jgi:hypothetical protein